MKLCWDNIENLYLMKGGKLRNRITGAKYIVVEECKGCGESFLSQPQSKGEYCTYKCKGKILKEPNKKKNIKLKKKLLDL